MIPDSLIQKAKDFALAQTEKYGAPALYHLELSNRKGQLLAKKLNADKDIIFIGTLLMDCMIGPAIQEGIIAKHVEMSATKAAKILSELPSLDEEASENILHCVKQHHGTDKFYSLEAEICCNADCYRFASVDGVIGGIRYVREMPLDNLIDILSKKADEKWSALTLDICKKDLEPQYKLIKKFLERYDRECVSA